MDLIGGNKDPRNTRTGRGQDQLNASSMGSTIGIVAVSFGALAAGAFANKLLGGLPTKLAGGLAKGIWGMLKGTMTGGKGAGDLLSAATGARVFVTNWPGGGFGGGLPDVPSGAPGAGRAAGGLLEKGAGLLRNAGLIAAAGAVGYGIGTIIEQNLPKNVKTGMQGFLAKNLFGASKTSSQIAAETQADVAAIRARAAANRKLAAAFKPNQYVNTAIKNADYSGVYKPAPIVPSKPAVVYRPAPVIPRGVTYGPPARAAPLPVRPIVKTPAVTQKFEIIIPSITGVDANVLAATLKTQLTQIALATAQRSAADTQRKLKAALDGANNGFENPKVYGPPSSLAGGG